MQQRVHTRLDTRVSITTLDNVETGWKSVRFNVNRASTDQWLLTGWKLKLRKHRLGGGWWWRERNVIIVLHP